jgi:hypothetical protein
LSHFFSALDPLLPAAAGQNGTTIGTGKTVVQPEAVKGGLTILTAAIFLAGEMAGSGVLALPYAILGTGETAAGWALIFFSKGQSH